MGRIDLLSLGKIKFQKGKNQWTSYAFFVLVLNKENLLLLSALIPHSEALFVSCSKPDLAAKLTDMGMLPGTRWQLLAKMPFHGPLLIDNEMARLSIRLDDGNFIWMEPVV